VVISLWFYIFPKDKKTNMKKSIPIVLVILLINSFVKLAAQAQVAPDTVKVGIYIVSIHDIDFKQKEYAISFWLWLKYKNKDFDFVKNLEVPQAKSVDKSFSVLDTSGEEVNLQMKMQCVMKDNWKIANFPFDKQKLRLSIENSQYDSRYLVFKPDTVGKHFDPRFVLNGWLIDSCIVSNGIKAYETAFGDESMSKPHTEYSSFRVRMSVHRDASGLFWKMFLGMYIAFLIAFICFFIHADGIDSRFGLSVGSLFAVIGNKYIIDSALPESSSFTLVDTLHGLTLFTIFTVITATAFSLRLVKKQKIAQAHRFDMIMAAIVFTIYIAANIWFISQAENVQ
jgi:hypothetical protein